MADGAPADRFCPSCGTEVEADARFCPTCGQTLIEDEMMSGAAPEPLEPEADAEAGGQAEADADAAATIEPEPEAETMAIPPAPAWPPPVEAVEPTPQEEPPAAPPRAYEEASEAPQIAAPPEAPPGATPGPPPGVPPGQGPRRDQPELPFTMPATLAGWLIGAGSLFAALALLPGLGNLLNLLLFLALLGISATIFMADRIPEIPRLRMATLVIVMVALGVALDRAAFTVRGVDTVFLIAMLVTAGGALLIELDRDQPVQPPGGRA